MPIRYVSTRGAAPPASFLDALLRGLAPDGGLYVPEAWPDLSGAAAGATFAETTARTIQAFDGGSLPEGAAGRAAERAAARFDDPEVVAPLTDLGRGLFLLELFHGPTAAFKDVAMRLAAPLIEAALTEREGRLLLVTATSGDTGAAAVSAFAGLQRVRLAVLHPLGRVSPVQRRQMTTVRADNVLNLAVRGDFDDCQGLLKRLLDDAGLRQGSAVSSVNSVNWGRLAGQVPYYLTAAERLPAARFVVPTGNFGDAFAGWVARRAGGALGPLVAAVNGNDALARALNEGRYVRRPAKLTASVSMDVQAPSNFERLWFEASNRDAERTRAFFEAFARDGEATIPDDVLRALRREVEAIAIGEEEAAAEIARTWREASVVVCPHTAVGLAAARRFGPAEGPTVVLATAHPAKFPEAVAPAIGRAPDAPESFAQFSGEERFTTVDADYAAVRAAVAAHAG